MGLAPLDEAVKLDANPQAKSGERQLHGQAKRMRIVAQAKRKPPPRALFRQVRQPRPAQLGRELLGTNLHQSGGHVDGLPLAFERPRKEHSVLDLNVLP